MRQMPLSQAPTPATFRAICIQANAHGAKRKGFTLIELLVVVSLISVLISMLLPALSRTRETAFDVTCKSNMRQMGIALAVYAGDYRNFILPVYVNNDWATSQWPQMYVKLGLLPKELMFCPAGPAKAPRPAWLHNNDQELRQGAYTYGINGGFFPPDMAQIKNLDSSQHPSRLVVYVDAITRLIEGGTMVLSDDARVQYNAIYPNAAWYPMHFRHLQQVNVTHLDGAVRGYTSNRMLDAIYYNGDVVWWQ